MCVAIRKKNWRKILLLNIIRLIQIINAIKTYCIFTKRLFGLENLSRKDIELDSENILFFILL